jgi:small subunit ribosomal protein S5
MAEEQTEAALWIPKTALGRAVFEGKITSLDEIFRSGKKIKEPQIVDMLLPGLQHDIVFIGGSPGKGGGSKKTPTMRTARMHRSGRRYNILSVVVVGNGDGYFGVGKGEALEHRTAIDKALMNAKLSIIPVRRGCGSWECACGKNHSIPFTVEGKKGSVRIVLKPAPKGIGLCINDEAKKAMRLAGISDIWSKSFGASSTRTNFIFAIYDAFKKMNKMKIEEPEKPEEKAEEPKKVSKKKVAKEEEALPKKKKAEEDAALPKEKKTRKKKKEEKEKKTKKREKKDVKEKKKKEEKKEPDEA